MAGLFPGICNAQNVDANGVPLANAELRVYNGGTTQLSAVYQDINLLIAAPNPMNADLTGRLPIFYVADGVYAVRLIDSTGRQIYYYPQVASIGASASGGGGTSVDPTTIFSTGDELFRKIGGIRNGWVRQNAGTIGSATSGASERANADCQALFLFLWANYPDAKCPVVTGRGLSAAADWAANKQITLPDMRGRGPMGKDQMGGPGRANRIADTDVTSPGDGGDTDSAFGGTDTSSIGQANLPAINLSFVGVSSASDQGGIPRNAADAAAQPNAGGFHTGNTNQFGNVTVTPLGGLTIGANPANGTNPTALGSGVALKTLDPFALGTWYIKL